MYTNSTDMLKYFFPPSLFGRNQNVTDLCVNNAPHCTAPGRIPVFHCFDANSGDISKTKILISR